MTSWHHNPCRKITAGFDLLFLFIWWMVDCWYLADFIHAHTHTPRAGWRVGVFRAWPLTAKGLFSSLPVCWRAAWFMCRTTPMLSKQLAAWLRKRFALTPDVTYFQAEVGPHVQLNHLWLSKNFLSAKRLKTDEPRTYKWPPRGIFKIISFS